MQVYSDALSAFLSYSHSIDFAVKGRTWEIYFEIMEIFYLFMPFHIHAYRCRPGSRFAVIYEWRSQHTSISGRCKICWYDCEHRLISCELILMHMLWSFFADVIHTDGGILGIPWALGHVDFYPNGGVALQPGCVAEELSKNNFLGIVGKIHFNTFLHSQLIPWDFFCATQQSAVVTLVRGSISSNPFDATMLSSANDASKPTTSPKSVYNQFPLTWALRQIDGFVVNST